MRSARDDAGLPGAAPGRPGHDPTDACPGCGRWTPYPRPGGRFLCARCHYPQRSPGAEDRIFGKWFRFLCRGGPGAVAAAGISLCALYLVGTGRVAWFTVLLLVMSLTVALPWVLYRRRRHLYLVIAALYIPLGLWCFLYCLAPGVGWDYSPSLLGGGFFFLAVGALAAYLYGRDLRSLPRR